MKLKIKDTPDQVELIKAMISSDKLKAIEARQAFAAAIGPVVLQVLDKMGTSQMIFEQMPFNEDTHPEIELDLYYDKAVNEVAVYHNGVGGSAPTSEVTGLKTLKLHWAEIESAVSLNKRYIERNNLPVVSKALNRLTQEILVKKEILAWSTLMKALGEARTNGADHIITSNAANQFIPHDMNRLIVLSKRINESFDGGTPTAMFSSGATDLFLSPETMALIREMAYNPINTRSGSVTTSGATSITAPESIRTQLWNASGISEFFGKSLHELNELGDGEIYCNFFAAYAPGSINHSNSNFSATDDLVVALDLSRDSFISPIAQNAENGATLVVEDDDMFQYNRSRKVGWFARQQQGFSIIDSRTMSAIIV
jgi:hypothetical protein